MSVKFVAGITAWNANAATATSAAFTPATGETLLICGEQFPATPVVITSSQGTPVVDVAQANSSGGGANGSNSSGHLLWTKGVSQTITVASTGGTFEAGFGIRYSGVAAVQKATLTLVAAPGTGANAIVGQPVVVPAGAILVVCCIDISNGPTTITSSNANASRFAVTTGNGVFNFFEFSGTGTTITPLCTTTTAADDYFMAQWLLIPAWAPPVVSKPVLFQKPFRLGFRGVTLDATPPVQSGNVTIALTGLTATFLAGLLGPTADLPLTGSTATLAAGTLSPSTSPALTGLSVTTSGGLQSPSDTVAIAGSTGTFSTGTLTPVIAPVLAGISVTYAAGLLNPATTVALTGATGTFSSGTLTPSGGSGGSVTVPLTGVSASFVAGTLTPSTSIALVGSTITSSAGSVIPANTVALSGQSLTLSNGTLLPSLVASLTGASITSIAGQASPGTSLGLGGLTINGSTGFGGATEDVPIVGQIATFGPGIITSSGGDPVAGTTLPLVGFVSNTGTLKIRL